jgi:hypothetical protein
VARSRDVPPHSFRIFLVEGNGGRPTSLASGKGLELSWWDHVAVVVGFAVSSPVVIVGLPCHRRSVRMSAPSFCGGDGVIVTTSVWGECEEGLGKTHWMGIPLPGSPPRISFFRTTEWGGGMLRGGGDDLAGVSSGTSERCGAEFLQRQ